MQKILISLIVLFGVFPFEVAAEYSEEKVKEIRSQSYWYGYSWGIISQTCFFYIDKEIDLEKGQKEVSSALELLGANAPGYIETAMDALASPQFKKCIELID